MCDGSFFASRATQTLNNRAKQLLYMQVHNTPVVIPNIALSLGNKENSSNSGSGSTRIIYMVKMGGESNGLFYSNYRFL
jgi:hypothetical protein